MSGLFRTRDALRLLRDALRPLGVDVFLTTRPKWHRERMDDFAVVSLPSRIENLTVGNCGMTRTTCRIALFVRDKDGREDIDRLDELTGKAEGLFPITGDGMTAWNPSVTMEGSDGNGFHVTVVQADFETH